MRNFFGSCTFFSAVITFSIVTLIISSALLIVSLQRGPEAASPNEKATSQVVQSVGEGNHAK